MGDIYTCSLLGYRCASLPKVKWVSWSSLDFFPFFSSIVCSFLFTLILGVTTVYTEQQQTDSKKITVEKGEKYLHEFNSVLGLFYDRYHSACKPPSEQNALLESYKQLLPFVCLWLFAIYQVYLAPVICSHIVVKVCDISCVDPVNVLVVTDSPFCSLKF